MSVLGGVLLAYLAFFLLTCRAPYSGDEWGPQWLSCARTVRSGASGRRYAKHIARTVRSAASWRRHAHCHAAEAARCWAVLPHESHAHRLRSHAHCPSLASGSDRYHRCPSRR